MLPAFQHINTKTAGRTDIIEMLVVEQRPQCFSVWFAENTFSNSDMFNTAEAAISAALSSLNSVLVPDIVTEMASGPTQQFVSNARLSELVQTSNKIRMSVEYQALLRYSLKLKAEIGSVNGKSFMTNPNDETVAVC